MLVEGRRRGMEMCWCVCMGGGGGGGEGEGDANNNRETEKKEILRHGNGRHGLNNQPLSVFSIHHYYTLAPQ